MISEKRMLQKAVSAQIETAKDYIDACATDKSFDDVFTHSELIALQADSQQANETINTLILQQMGFVGFTQLTPYKADNTGERG